MLEATQVIGKLGANIEIIFRNSKERKPYHSLKDELMLVENYLFIQQTRYQEKLKFQVPDKMK
ncbi:MAG: histidine kinase [Saprospiraceae bacterium]|nr:histidine kinase [Saprospiraceae bacterium]